MNVTLTTHLPLSLFFFLNVVRFVTLMTLVFAVVGDTLILVTNLKLREREDVMNCVTGTGSGTMWSGNPGIPMDVGGAFGFALSRVLKIFTLLSFFLSELPLSWLSTKWEEGRMRLLRSAFEPLSTTSSGGWFMGASMVYLGSSDLGIRTLESSRLAAWFLLVLGGLNLVIGVTFRSSLHKYRSSIETLKQSISSSSSPPPLHNNINQNEKLSSMFTTTTITANSLDSRSNEKDRDRDGSSALVAPSLRQVIVHSNDSHSFDLPPVPATIFSRLPNLERTLSPPFSSTFLIPTSTLTPTLTNTNPKPNNEPKMSSVYLDPINKNNSMNRPTSTATSISVYSQKTTTTTTTTTITQPPPLPVSTPSSPTIHLIQTLKRQKIDKKEQKKLTTVERGHSSQVTTAVAVRRALTNGREWTLAEREKLGPMAFFERERQVTTM